jgi:hypothetical protein
VTSTSNMKTPYVLLFIASLAGVLALIFG